MSEELAPNEKRCTKCKEVKNKIEFYKDRGGKDGLAYICKNCRLRNEERLRVIKLSKQEQNPIRCPICSKDYLSLTTHVRMTHNLTKNDLRNLGIGEFTSPSFKVRRSKISTRPLLSNRRGYIAEIKMGYFSFPDECWPKDCKFAKVIVRKKEFQIQFNPCLTRQPNTKFVLKKGQRGVHRLYIKCNPKITEQLEIARPLLILRQGAGFIIQFYQEDGELLEPLEFWAKSSFVMRNIAPMSIYRNGKDARLSVADHIWPINAEFVYLELTRSGRKNAKDYLDLIPVSRTGFIVDVKTGVFKQYIGVENCRKVNRDGKFSRRFRIRAIDICRDNNIPPSNWDLKEVLPSGALRFRMYRERETQKEAS